MKHWRVYYIKNVHSAEIVLYGSYSTEHSASIAARQLNNNGAYGVRVENSFNKVSKSWQTKEYSNI